MKSTTYIVETTNQTNEKYLYVGEIQLLGCLLAFSPCVN